MPFFTPKQPVFYILFKDLNKNLGDIIKVFESLATEFKDFEKYSEKAKELEHKGDHNSRAIVEKLNKTFITPFDREDIYKLAGEMDDIIDLTEDAIKNIHLYRVTENHPAIKKFAHLMFKASECLTELLDCLEKQKHSATLSKAKIRMHDLEEEADEVFTRAIAELFQNHTDPITLIKLKDILENLENIMDKFQQVGDIIEGIIVKSS